MLAVADSVSQAGSGAQAGGVHLVGHSMGGLIARSAALLAHGPDPVADPDRLRARRDRRAERGRRCARRWRCSTQPGAAGPGRPRRARPRWSAQVWRERLEPQARAEGTDERIIAFLRERTHARPARIGLIVMARYLLSCPDRTEELAALARPVKPSGAVQLPVLVIYGENDDAWPPAAQDRMARRLSAERACIPGAAHSPAIEAPDTTGRALTTFWNAAEAHRPSAGQARPARRLAGRHRARRLGAASPARGQAVPGQPGLRPAALPSGQWARKSHQPHAAPGRAANSLAPPRSPASR